MPSERDEFGLCGEQSAEQFLLAAGLTFLARRFRTPVGELDLVFRDGRTVVFVEVKTQRDRRLLDPGERVRSTKRRRLLAAARWYLENRRLTGRPCRFDIVEVVLPEAGEVEIRHVREAFLPEERSGRSRSI